MPVGKGKSTLQSARQQGLGNLGIVGEGNQTLPSPRQRAICGVIVERLPDDHPYYALIGRVAAESAHLEHILDLTIWDILRDPHTMASCITGKLIGVGTRLEVIKSLADYQGISKDLITKYNKLGGEVSELNRKRNRYIHDAWFHFTDGVELSEVGQFKNYARETQKAGFDPISEKEIRDFLRKLRKSTETAVSLRTDLQAERHS